MNRHIKNEIKKEKIKYIVDSWREDYSFRTFLTAGGAFLANCVFALYNGYLGIHLSSDWNGSICVYYILLAIIRGVIIFSQDYLYKKKPANEKQMMQKTFLFTSVVLFLINLALMIPITLMVKLKRPVRYGLIHCLCLAAYTVYKVTMASIHFRRKEKSSNLFVRELRSINLMDALLSIITLQNALISYKGTSSTVFAVSAVASAVLLLQMIWISIKNLCTGKELL